MTCALVTARKYSYIPYFINTFPPPKERQCVLPLQLLTHPAVLEIGCYIGFSALGWSHAVGPSGHVTTLESSPEYADIARITFEKNGVKNVDVIVGNANET